MPVPRAWRQGTAISYLSWVVTSVTNLKETSLNVLNRNVKCEWKFPHYTITPCGQRPTYPGNENQLDTLFIISLVRQSASTCFGQTVCIVVVDLCVLLSYVYLLYYVCSVFFCFFFYFKCRTAGYRSILGRSWDRPPWHRFCLVSLCRKANAEMVPKIPSCHYMLLM